MKNIILIIYLLSFGAIESFTQTLYEEIAIITKISDGDTIDVQIDGEDQTKSIRVLGIQTMEVNPGDIPNDCYADEATRRIEEITGGVGARVILRSQNPNAIDRFGRLRRHVFVVNNGKEVNIGKRLLEEGLAFSLTMDNETIYDAEYAQIAQIAKSKSLGLWSSIGISSANHCPVSADSANSSFEIVANFDANGDDNQNVNGEWIKIKNTSGRSVDISHWWLRDSALYFFRFPSSTVLENGEEVTVFIGKGQNTKNTFYWGKDFPILDNTWDGIYLHDYLDYGTDYSNSRDLPRGNIKAAFLYPCLTECTDDLKNKIFITANPDAPGNDQQNVNGEWIQITNIFHKDIDLKNYLLHYSEQGSQSYYFHQTTILHPHDVLTLHMGKGTDTRLQKYVGKSTPILANTKGKAWLTTMDGIQISSFSWPSVDTDGDGLLDNIDEDDDNDGVSDIDEILAGTNPLDRYDKPFTDKDAALLVPIINLLTE
jgi:endonuclease YncB( thermonuclease family)